MSYISEYTPRSHIPSPDAEMADIADYTVAPCATYMTDDVAAIQAQPNLTLPLTLDPMAQNLSLNLSLPFAIDESDLILSSNITTAQPHTHETPSLGLDFAQVESLSDLGPPPSVNQDLEFNMPLFSSEIFLWSPTLAIAPSPENLDSYLVSPSSLRAQSPLVESAVSDATLGGDLTVHLSLLRQCMGSGHSEAGLAIFSNLMKRILTRAPQEAILSSLEVVFKGEPLAFATAEARFDAAILERQQRHGFDHPVTIQMCLALVEFLHSAVENDQSAVDWDQKTAEYRLERSRSLLERVLRTGFDDEVVRESMRCNDALEDTAEEPEPQQLGARDKMPETELMEAYIIGCTKRPFLLHAIIESTQYSKLHWCYTVTKTVESLVEMGLASRCIVSRAGFVLTCCRKS